MHIIYIHQYFNTPKMSGGTRSYELARRFVREGHTVDMITSDRRPSAADHTWQTEMTDGIRVHWWPSEYSNDMSYFRRAKAFFSFSRAAAARAAKIRADIVFATSTPLTVALPGYWASRRLKVPMVFEVRDLWPELPIAIGAIRNPVAKAIARWLERFAYRHSAHVIALSPGMADGIARTGIPRECVSVIPNGCDLELFKRDEEAGRILLGELGIPGDRPLLLYAGTLGKLNGVGYLVDIALEMRRIGSRAQFLIIGDGAERCAILEKAKASGVLENNLWMLPRMSKERMAAAFSAATIGCSLFINLPEMWNNSANKFFDTLASGIPVAINYGGWQADLIKREGIGIVLPPDDAQTAASDLDRFLLTQDLERIGGTARGLATERFSRDELAMQVLDVLTAAAEAAR